MKALRNARVYRYDPRRGSYSRHNGLVLDGPTIVSLDPSSAGATVEGIDLQGATVLPAFADCHVHLTDTGHFLDERNLNGVRSYDEFAAAVTRLPRETYVLAGQYDESAWRDGRLADAAPLERELADAFAMLVRVDGHSCIVNRKTLAWLNLPPAVGGSERNHEGGPTGKLFLEANWRAQAAFMAKLPLAAKRAADKRATELALSRGCLHLHAQFVGFARDQYADEIAALGDLPRAKWYPKICEPDPRLAKELGLPFIGGDVFLDGSIGSCTAAVSEPFVSQNGGPPNRGELNYSDEQVYEYFSTADSLGVSAGVHAIGDRAIEQCVATWERVLGGKPSATGCRHFIEHFEIARDDHIERCARLGIYLSMQPQFDMLWGGVGGMYEQRLGSQRMRSMNALGRIERAGAVLCGGDDSPVCELAPLQGMQATVDHHEPRERLSPGQAITMYTYNAARLAHAEMRTGMLAEGYAADLAILDRDPLDGDEFTDCRVLATWCDGEVVYAEDQTR
ncbi:MAG TPA: amidohydrolase family protein [Candidatus Rubrimentiphilum sp.]|nr:amidohydrolase family protein [Candidatus Rubrimentiphilum sp.]